jgi:transcriptional regulator with XRE-family HTH domain
MSNASSDMMNDEAPDCQIERSDRWSERMATPDRESIVDVIAAALRRERARTGLSLAEVARRAGIAKSTLSQLENGTGNPSIETLWALCGPLGISFGDLVDPSTPKVHVIRAGEGARVRASDADYTTSLLSAGSVGERRDVYRITAEPGDAHVSDPHPGRVVEHLVVVRGSAKAGPPEDPVTVEVGDYVAYPGDERHLFEALEPGTVAIIVSESR